MKRNLLWFFMLAGSCLCSRGAGIDNRELVPVYKPDSEVRMERRADGRLETPDWLKSLILMEVRIDAASPDETLKGMGPVLDHLAEMGVNGIWLTPPVNASTGYGNFGVHTISARLTGEKEPAKQWQVLKNFVDEAHRRNIRVFFDVVTWGVTTNEGGAPILKERPEWFGSYFPPYRGHLFNWENRELREWFAARLVEWFQRTGVDGFRCDCEPEYAGFDLFRVVKKRMREKGRKVVFLSEWPSSRKNVFDLEQNSFCYRNEKGTIYARWFGDTHLNPAKNLVDDIRSGGDMRARDDFDREPGMERYYTYMLSCHDSPRYLVNGSPIAIGYQAIFAPFIPLWYIGEEWNNPSRFFIDSYYRTYQRNGEWKPEDRKSWNLYGNVVDWNVKEKNRAFFELVKKMIRIRRQYPEIFEYFPDNHRESNICKVTTDRDGLLQPYARYRSGTAVLVVPNNGSAPAAMKISLPFREAGLEPGREYEIFDLLNDRPVAAGKLVEFRTEIPAGELGVYLVKPRKK